MSKLLPNIDKKQLKLTSHYISNALNSERKHELGERSRKGNAPKDRNAALLSSTVLEDFEETMLPDDENSTSEDTDQDGLTSSSQPLDDSITALKQTISTENKADDEQIACTPNYQKSTKCDESCKFSQKHKKKVQMIQCCFCMSWYHQLCVGIGKDDPIGIWVCLNCRSVPTSIQNEISNLKLDVDQLKTTTELILSSVTTLTTKLENSMGGFNDRLTALTRQINLHDITTTEANNSVENLMRAL